MLSRFCHLSVSALLLTASARAGTIYVDVNLTTGANNGASWADAYRTVDGVAVALVASVSGDQIWVAAGTYKPTVTATRTITHVLKNGVQVYGGFTGTEVSLAQRNPTLNVTTLSGDLAGNDGSSIFTDNSIHLLNGSLLNATAIIDGFTVRAGNANVAGSNQDRGGGILCVAGSSPTVRRCLFFQNRCSFGGGAGYINSSSPTFTDCIFDSNFGASFGGAFDMATSVGATFDRCIFRGNTAARAGAIEIFGSSPVKVYNSLFHGNICTGTGGGGAIFVSASNPLIRDCTITGNSATATASAGILGTTTSSIINCVVWNNVGPGGAMAPINQISPTTLTTVTYSCVTGGYAGLGNLAVNPMFVNPGANDFRLQITSPCIDAGNNAGVAAGITADLVGRPRFSDEPTVADTGAGTAPIVDMGAFELPAPAVAAYCFGDGLTSTPCPCGNNTVFGLEEGCLNSFGVGGKLTYSGSARIASDTFVLLGSQMPNSSALYFQGTTQVAGGMGAGFGDGLRCAGGTVVRLGTKTNVAGASQYPTGGDMSVSTRGQVTVPGSVRTYQVWYRNAANFCTFDTFNLTDALSVTWEL